MALGPMSTPRRPAPKSMGTPMMSICIPLLPALVAAQKAPRDPDEPPVPLRLRQRLRLLQDATYVPVQARLAPAVAGRDLRALGVRVPRRFQQGAGRREIVSRVVPGGEAEPAGRDLPVVLPNERTRHVILLP